MSFTSSTDRPTAAGSPSSAIVACWTLVGVVIALIGFNQYLFWTLSPARAAGGTAATGGATDSISLTLATGVPATYGSELSVSYDQVEQSMNIMAAYDPDYGSQPVALTPEQQQRYVAIGTKISCEYCCGAKAIVAPNGKAACGCAHSQAMRGLAVYLLSKHGSQYSDDQILRELARWKARYFPKQMIGKMESQRASGQYTTDIAALLLGVANPSTSGQPATSAPLPSSLQNLPNMVGGC